MRKNDDFGLEKYIISYLDLQNDILRISGEKNAAEKSHENFLDREIEFLVIFTSAEIDSEDLTKNNCKFKFDEPPGYKFVYEIERK